MWKYIVGGALVAVALVTGVYLYTSGAFVFDTKKTEEAQQPQQVATTTYATTTFSLIFPTNFSKNESYAYEAFGPKKLIRGVKFTVPMEMATGTNLSSETGISIEQLPRAINCTGDIYVQADVKAQEWTDNGVKYSVATTSGAAAGNMYEEYVYALTGTKPCTAVRYFIHSTNIGNYPAGTVSVFDKTALMAAFDEIRRTLVFKAR